MDCFSCFGRRPASTPTDETKLALTSSPPPNRYLDNPPPCTPSLVAERVLGVIRSSDTDVDATVQAILISSTPAGKSSENFNAQSWYTAVAEALIDRLVTFVRQLRENAEFEVGNAFKAAYDTAAEYAKDVLDIAEEHPFYVALIGTVIAIGILYLIWPWAIAVIGFEDTGVVAGSWAARWQSLYKGYVRRGSIFSYLQHLGAIARRTVSVSLTLEI